MKRVTIHDVARSAGVSRQTVSRALNDKAEIDGGTKQRVLDAARTLGYRPSRFARGLVRQDTVTIGLVIPDLRNPFFTEIAASALEAARARDWHVVVHDTADSPEREIGTLRVIGSQVDAVVGYFSQSEEEIERHVAGLPVVFLGREHRNPRFSSIRIDGEAGIAAAVDHLVAAGHTRIGMLDHNRRNEPSIRQRWFRTAAASAGLVLDPGWILGANQSVDGGALAFEALHAAHPEITALLTFNDIIAIGALRRARQLGLRVPADLALIGFDGLELGALIDPPLTSVAIDTNRLGTLAIEDVARLLAGDRAAAPEDLVVRGALRLRGSA
ncbi:LacI family DNA-binding transcriptional regulator [Crossiella cryophila]|uniref:LacI family transcriptional regulator n=1 Tax=Crossiella cryophila TaxID=43355 RepID=A0A7W7FVB9_9PSEU|nr:LacI family DNA-binding transcriptional regulator [Crossiella cryophila]MBB4680241.1 LacI family transcriptional regulator [Crossiella cryophila]